MFNKKFQSILLGAIIIFGLLYLISITGLKYLKTEYYQSYCRNRVKTLNTIDICRTINEVLNK